MRYIALLRGINVGGRYIKMEPLRRIFADLGLANVGSYIQSGNLFFDSAEGDRAVLRRQLEARLLESLGYAVPVCLRTVAELEGVMALDPFAGVAVTPETRLSVAFLAEPVTLDLPVRYRTPKGDFELVGKTDTELFVVWHLVNGRPGNGFALVEKAVPVPSTTRFWHTSAKILAAARRP
ncbi:MAG TPA: DUF1697 domain-containing protein [Thermomicrobiales bacterium]|jgi:uncharacterized protein (DUF1697 family)